MRIAVAFSFLLFTAFAACTHVEMEESIKTDSETTTIYRVHFDASIEAFDSSPHTRGKTEEIWKDGDCVYLNLSVDTSIVKGTLSYDASTGEWSLRYNGSITPTNRSACEAVFFSGEYSVGNNIASFSQSCILYWDGKASYSFVNGVMKIAVTLYPVTGRIRFKGTPGTVFKVYGLNTFESFDFLTQKFKQKQVYARRATADIPIQFSIGPDGYSNYAYARSDAGSIDIEMGDYMYTTNLSSLTAGKSGVMQLPKEYNHNGWKKTKDKYVVLDDVVFKMIYVEGGSFLMGDNALGNNRPKVSVRGFYIGETEVSCALYSKVMGTTTTTPQLPSKAGQVNNLTFISKLESKTSITQV